MTDAALIEAYLAKGGKVTKCPTGASALTLEYVWVEGKGLIAKDQEKAKQAFRHSVGSSFASPKRRLTPEQIKRRETVASLMDAGNTGVEIATMLGLNVHTVYDDAAAMGRKFPRITPPRPKLTHVHERREKVAKMAKDGLTVREMVQRLDTPEGTIRHDLGILGIKLDRSRATRRAWAAGRLSATKRNATSFAPSKEVAARRAKVPGMIAKGMRTIDIARALGVATGVIRHDCRHLGIPSPSKAQQQMQEAA